MNRKRILIADDQPFMQRFFSKALEDIPVSCYLASDGIEAVRLAEQLEPDLVLMDYRMPNMDGRQAVQLIRESVNPRVAMTKVIIVTAECRQVAERFSGFDGCILKPIRAEEFKDLICAHLGLDSGTSDGLPPLAPTFSR